MSNIYYFFSCFNNYDLLIGEQKEFLIKNKQKVIVLDDHSEKDEQQKGKKFCNENSIKYVVNKGKGFQAGIEFLVKEVIPHASWLICLQQDTSFYKCDETLPHLEKRLDIIQDKNLPIGAIGFQNYVINSSFNENQSYEEAFKEMNTALGIFTLSDVRLFAPKKFKSKILLKLANVNILSKITKKFKHKVVINRVFAPKTFDKFHLFKKKYQGLCSIELPVWACVAINTKLWKQHIVLDTNFIFHLWFPDVAMQFMNKNVHICLDATIPLLNDLGVKEKYGYSDSVKEGRKKSSKKMEPYGNHLSVFEKKWGFDYEYHYPHLDYLQKKYSGTLIEKHMRNDPRNGPIKTFKLGKTI